MFQIVSKNKYDMERYINYYIEFEWKKDKIALGGLTYSKWSYFKNRLTSYIWLNEERRDRFYWKKAEQEAIRIYMRLIATNGDYYKPDRERYKEIKEVEYEK